VCHENVTFIYFLVSLLLWLTGILNILENALNEVPTRLGFSMIEIGKWAGCV